MKKVKILHYNLEEFLDWISDGIGNKVTIEFLPYDYVTIEAEETPELLDAINDFEGTKAEIKII